MNARKIISAVLALAVCGTALGATVPRLFPEGIKLGTIEAKDANGVSIPSKVTLGPATNYNSLTHYINGGLYNARSATSGDVTIAGFYNLDGTNNIRMTIGVDQDDKYTFQNLDYSAGAQGHSFRAGNTEVGKYQNAGAWTMLGNVTSTGGDFIPATAGKGVDFSANTHASGMTSEKLNWYEEGSWTPTVSGTSTAGVGTYTVQVGRYVRIGRMVQIQGSVTTTAHTGTGNMIIAGLPFTALNVGNLYGHCSNFDFSGLAVPASTIPMGWINPNGTLLNIGSSPVGGGNTAALALDTAFTLFFTCSYQAN